ncbi:coactosin-like protein isoform X1 [Danaus plexippus]|uniref:Coactosin-like protein n=1 Tax=Danaus plexippus plexippus TaxID=278856 RepID=A0A212FPY5_DANPL|nr:coactosin-like protein isoform X1 [Danaus plexippus]OWR55749.1 cyclic AMP-regulated protein [Danaus plexippus plexippus]
MADEQSQMDRNLKQLTERVEKIGNIQTNLGNKYEGLKRTVEDIQRVVGQLAERITGLEDGAEKKRVRNDLNSMKTRIDELFLIVKDGKEDDSLRGDDLRDVDSSHSGLSGSSKVTMTTGLDRDTIRAAYEDVRSDSSPTEWAVFKFEGTRIVCAARGGDFSEFRTHFADDERAFGYLRMQMGDEMSKRKKFMLMTWVGPNVSVINRAKMSTDKAIIKDIISNFAVELQLESQSEIDIDQFKEALNRAGGANYGTGIRDL